MKVKGGSHVSWEESSGMTSRRYRDHYEFFKVKKYLVAEKHEGMSIQRGMAAVTCFTFLNTRVEWHRDDADSFSLYFFHLFVCPHVVVVGYMHTRQLTVQCNALSAPELSMKPMKNTVFKWFSTNFFSIFVKLMDYTLEF